MTLHDKYESAPRRAYEGEINDLTDSGTTLRVALLDVNHEPNLTGHETWADVSADDIDNTAANSTGYTAGGETIDNLAWSSSDRVSQLDGDDVSWDVSTIDAGYAVTYDDTPVADADKSLLTLIDFEEEMSSEDGEFTVDWDATNGIFRIDTDP